MSDTIWQVFQDSGPLAVLGALGLFMLYVVLGLLPTFALLYLVYFLLTLPMRRNERARFFLDVLALGLKEGRSAESAIMEAASSHDQSLGVRFHLLSAYLEQGMRLSQALPQVPRLLPPEVNSMLRVGEKIGDISKVIPACRRYLADGVSRVRGAHNYLILLVFVFTPLLVGLPWVLRVKVLPVYNEVFREMLHGILPPFTRFVFGSDFWGIGIQAAMIVCLWLLTLAYLGGPRLRAGLHAAAPATIDRFLFKFPWRRKRALRDFSGMLAVLLDSGVPEAEALTLAAEATGNSVIQQRTDQARALLATGVKLPEAVSKTSDSQELRWRLGNALRQGRNFVRALSGWHDALDAQAFQFEQTAAQVATTGMVLLNGVLVASVVIAVFLCLIQMINEAVLW